MLFGTLYFLEYNLLTIMAQTINGWYSELYFAIYERFQNMLTRKVKGKKGRKGNYRLFNWYNDGNSNKRGKIKKAQNYGKKEQKITETAEMRTPWWETNKRLRTAIKSAKKKVLKVFFIYSIFLFNWYIYFTLSFTVCGGWNDKLGQKTPRTILKKK